MADKDTKRPPVRITAQEPEPTPPRENTAAWVEKYAKWATQVVVAHAAKNDD